MMRSHFFNLRRVRNGNKGETDTREELLKLLYKTIYALAFAFWSRPTRSKLLCRELPTELDQRASGVGS